MANKDLTKIKTILKKNTIRPILGNILVKNKQIIATNLEQTIIINNEKEIENGVYTPLQFECEVYDKKLFDIEDFPVIKEITGPKIIIKNLIENLEKVFFAAAGKDNPNLNIKCVRIECKNNKVTYIATDSYQMIVIKDDTEQQIKDFTISVPIKAITSLIKIFNKKEIEIIINEKSETMNENIIIQFKQNNVLLISHLIDLGFIDYKTLISTDNKKNTKCDGKELQNILKKMKKISPEISFKISENIITIIAKNDEIELKEIIECNSNEKNVIIHLTTKFIYNFLSKNKKNKEINITFWPEYGAIIIDNEFILMGRK